MNLNGLYAEIAGFVLLVKAIGICAFYTGLVLALPVVSVVSVMEKKERGL